MALSEGILVNVTAGEGILVKVALGEGIQHDRWPGHST